jgi:plastocyanin
MRRLALPLAGLCGLALAVVPALAADQTVNVQGTSFVPATVTIAPGEKVTVKKSGGLHDLYWTDDAPGHPSTPKGSGDPAPWETERTFPAAGDYVFYCSVHGSAAGGMRGVVRVRAPETGGGGTTTSDQPPPTGTTTSEQPPPGGTTTDQAPAADSAAPRVLTASATATRRGVRVRLTLDERATVTARLFRGRRLLVLRTVLVRPKLSFFLARRLRRGPYSVRLRLEDVAGNVARRSLSARLR